MAKNTQGVTQVRQIKPDYIDNLVTEPSKKHLWTQVIENNDPNESYDIFYNKTLPTKTYTSRLTTSQKSLKLYKKLIKWPTPEKKLKYK